MKDDDNTSKDKQRLIKKLSGHRFERAVLREQLYRKRFLVPNAVTLANLFCGFLAIVYGSSGRYIEATIAIGIAILLDGLDGRVARRLNATSAFGVEFDSFSDLVSFGLAPALLVYNWAFKEVADEFGVIVCFAFTLAAAGRLARFNIQAASLRTFSGLPTPAAAAFVASGVHAIPHWEMTKTTVGFFAATMLLLAYLMISQIPFFSLKTVTISKRMSSPIMAFMGGVIALLWYNNKIGLFLVASGYVLSGPVLWIKNRKNLLEKAGRPVEEDAFASSDVQSQDKASLNKPNKNSDTTTILQ